VAILFSPIEGVGSDDLASRPYLDAYGLEAGGTEVLLCLSQDVWR
jgi:hypothetical protein